MKRREIILGSIDTGVHATHHGIMAAAATRASPILFIKIARAVWA